MQAFSREFSTAAVAGIALAAATVARATPIQLTLTATNLTNPAVYSTTFSDVILGGDTVTGSSFANYIVIPAGVQGGIAFSGEQSTALVGPGLSSLITSALSVTNTSTTDTYMLTAAFSGMNFSGPANQLSITASGTWQLNGGSIMNLAFYIDPTNTLGASTATDHPGTLVGQFTTPPAGAITSSFSYSPPVSGIPDLNSGLYSMTEVWSYMLIPGGALVSRGQTESETFQAIEPSSLAMFGIGLSGLLMARKRSAAERDAAAAATDRRDGGTGHRDIA